MDDRILYDMFHGRNLVIATKHGKETVIAPIISSAIHVTCFAPDNFDTDLLGTFTGEVERINDPLQTAKNKCFMAMGLNACDMAIASEGSFEPHPALGFINTDEEILMFIDKKNNLEISVRELSLNTNFNGQEVLTEKQLLDFAKIAKFPSHGLILRESNISTIEIIKGITDVELLKRSFKALKKKYDKVYVETDMRAMFNPTRMEVIQNATRKLAEKIINCCPQCGTPGFGVTDIKSGLPCSLCGFPTKSTLAHIYSCNKCNYTEEKKFPVEKFEEDPTHCDICNP